MTDDATQAGQERPVPQDQEPPFPQTAMTGAAWTGSPTSSSTATLAADQTVEAERTSFAVGDHVTWSFFDPYVGAGGEDAELHGVVLAVDDTNDDGITRYRVAWFRDVSDPIPADELVAR